MRASRQVTAALFAMILVAACSATGGTPAPTPAATRADPCTLLTQAEIKSATGTDSGPAVADTYGHCRWLLGGSAVDEGKGMISVSFAPPTDTLASIKAHSFGGADMTISGHPAYWDTAAMGATMYVDLGTSVLVVGFDAPGGPEMAQKLAEVVIAKL